MSNNNEADEEKTALRIGKRQIKINWDKQGRYMSGHPNYIKGKNIFTYPIPQEIRDKFPSTKAPTITKANTLLEKSKVKNDVELKQHILLSFQRALLGWVPASLRGVTVD
jgi:hypothetical protein